MQIEGNHLQASTVVCQLPNSLQDQVDHLLAHGVVASGIVVGRIFLARHLGQNSAKTGRNPGRSFTICSGWKSWR